MVIGIASAVIASLIMLFIERKVFPIKERKGQPPQIIYVGERHKENTRAAAASEARHVPGWAMLALSVCLPPLAVYLEKGARKAFWINVGLTLLWLWPGIVHSLLIVFGLRVKPA